MGTAVDHDGDRGIDRHDAAGRVLDSGRRCRPHPHGLRMRPPHRRDGVGGSDAEQDPDPQGVRERDHGGDGDGLLDQRDHPSDRAGAPRRPGHRARRFRDGQPQGARDRQCPAERRQISDGGFLLCRRPAGPDEPHQGASASRRA